MGKSRRAVVAAFVAALFVAAGVVAPAADAFDPNNFGFGPINDDAGPAQDPIALPGASHAFWAGTCDRAAAPDPPADIAPLGGIGTLPNTVFAPNGSGALHVPVPAPSTPSDCMDWGAPATGFSTGALLWTPSRLPSWRLPPDARAGGHPDGTTSFWMNRNPGDGLTIDGSLDNIVAELPPGFVGNPEAVAKCSAEQFRAQPLACPPQSQVGVLHLEIQAVFGAGNTPAGNERIYPVYTLEPRRGNAAELGFGYASGEDAVTVRLVAKARTNSDFGVTVFVGQIPAALQVRSQQITIWGVPWAQSNDIWRGASGLKTGASLPGACNFQPGVAAGIIYYLPYSGLTEPGCAQGYDPSWGPIKPFISNLTECTGNQLSTRVAIDQFQQPGSWISDGRPLDPVSGKIGGPNGDPDYTDPNWRVYDAPAPPMTGCEKVPFDATMDLRPTSAAADAPSGLSVDLGIPQEVNAPPAAPPVTADQGSIDDYVAAATDHWRSDAGLATAHLDRSVVTLPEGFSVNPSSAAGLAGCSDAGIGVRQQGNPPLFNNGDPFNGDGGADGAECPQASIIGDVTVDVPVLEQPLEGHVVLGEPKSTDPQSGEMFRMFILVKDAERGVIAKIYGSAFADPSTGRITATFDRNPRVPFEDLHIDFKQGPRGILATPQRCDGAYGWQSTFTPWTAAHDAGGQPVPVGGAMTVDQRCGFGFAPALLAGMDRQQGRAHGTFSFRFSRADGEQYLRGLTASLPQGLLASVRDLPLCTNAQAAAGACPLGSQIGIVDAKAGAGDPFVLEEKGRVYLTEGYKGGPYGLAVEIHPIAGPFRGAMALSPIIVRQAIHVDRKTAQVTAVSDPFPLIHHGVPLRVREVAVLVDRSRFMLNPSGCSARQVRADIVSAQGAVASPASHFQARGCRDLRFKPRLKLALKGRRQVRTGKHPAIRAVVRQRGIPEAGIAKAEVTLPKSLALDVNNAQALCEFEDGTKPDLENHCPKGSIVGRARAKTPLLNDDLVGDIYFVKNVRIDSDTGNEIRTLPMIVVALRGEIAVNLIGESNTTKSGRLVNTFDNVPDAPITRFNLNIKGGSNGILAVTRTRRSRINLCKRPNRHIAEADMDGHNGKRHDRNIRMNTPCRKKKRPSAAKVCRKRTDTKQAFRRCVTKVKRHRAQAKRRAAKKKAAKQKASRS